MECSVGASLACWTIVVLLQLPRHCTNIDILLACQKERGSQESKIAGYGPSTPGRADIFSVFMLDVDLLNFQAGPIQLKQSRAGSMASVHVKDAEEVSRMFQHLFYAKSLA